MSIKLRALGLGLLAMVAMGAIAVMNASAESSANGHFTSEGAGVTTLGITTTPGTIHQFELAVVGLTPIVCHDATYTASFTTTASHITATPSFAKCFTTGGTPGETLITPNGCDFTFTKSALNAAATVNTVELTCAPPSTGITIHHAGCTTTIMPHHFKGVGYTTTVENNKQAITLTADVALPSGTVTLTTASARCSAQTSRARSKARRQLKAQTQLANSLASQRQVLPDPTTGEGGFERPVGAEKRSRSRPGT